MTIYEITSSLTVFLRSHKVPTIIIKDEDLEPLGIWKGQWDIPIYIFHVFYDQGFFISFNRALELIKRSHCCPVKTRTESTGCDFRLNRLGSPMLPRPVKWALSRKE